MAVWPTVPEPRQCTPFSVFDPMYSYQVDQGYELRRSRSSRSRRGYSLSYLEAADQMYIITDFIERVIRVNALSFDWTYPYGSAFDIINTGIPNIVFTSGFAHNLQTGHSVDIVGSATHDGTYTITRLLDDAFALDGTSGGVSDTEGTYAIRFPRMLCKFPSDRMPIPEIISDFGAYRNDEGLARLTFQIEEDY